MNISQKQTILNEIEQIQTIDFDQVVLSNFPESTDLGTVTFGRFNAKEFKANLYRCIKQLKAELESGLGLLLPNSENFQNDFGAVTLDSDIIQLKAAILDISIRDTAAAYLDRFMYYQVRQGFWDKSTVKIHDVNAKEITASKQELILAQKHLANGLKSFQTLNTDYQNKLANLDSIIIEKRDELAEISNLLNNATVTNAGITRVSVEAANSNNQIVTLLKAAEDKVNAVNESIREYQSTYNSYNTESNQFKQTLESAIGEAKAELLKSKEDLSFIESKKEEITRLTGMAADGSLGSKFDQRHINLQKGVEFWKWAVPIVTILSIIWVIIVFTVLGAHTDNQWANLLINLLKTSPAFILMGFVFSQYSKERNLQEEYAFKSAVAMTITAYSAMLEDKDDEPNKSRQDMLLRSIQQIYLQPKLYTDKADKIYSMNAKNLKEAIQTLTETVKEIKK